MPWAAIPAEVGLRADDSPGCLAETLATEASARAYVVPGGEG